MADKNKTLVTFRVTPREYAALTTLAGGRKSDYLRTLVARDAQARGVEWPAEMSDNRGKYERKR